MTDMRDLEQIEEHDLDRPERSVGTLLMAALLTVGLVFAMGMLLGSADADDGAEVDPLDALDRAAQLEVTSEAEVPEEVSVNRETLAFPETLGDRRADMEATLAAAQAELAHPEPMGQQGMPASVAMPSFAAPTPLPSSLPAAVSASPDGDELSLGLRSDPMVRAALAPSASHESDSRAPAAAGHDGRFTLQVISYTTQGEADGFAGELRERGHEAFVTSAEIPNRGRFFRVRVGPFDNQREADSYRSSFEAEEQMNTFVVRQRDEE